jgi:hypothetical protein
LDPRISDTRIKLVRNDTGPQVSLTLTDESTGAAINLSGATATLHFRAVGGDTLFSRALTIPSPTATQGVAIIVWQIGDLDHPAGYYEGEVEVVLQTGVRQTVYDPLQFRIRDDFG